MWANPTLSTSTLFPPATATTTAGNNRRPVTVSAKPRKNLNYNYHYDETETETDREFKALKQQEEISDPDSYISNNSEKISGSVVLLALQKASAQKTLKKMTKKKKSKNIKMDEGNWRKRKEGEVVEDYGDVKPLCIKSDWKERLDDLEMQLNQLVHHA